MISSNQPVGWLETLDETDATWAPAWWQQAAQPQDTLVGTAGDDLLRGTAGDDDIDGLVGADTMVGRLGNDTFHVDNAGDLVKERAGEGTDTVIASVDYTLGANVENLTLDPTQISPLNGTGNKLDNLIQDNYGSNLLDGGDGNDTLIGGHRVSPANADTLIGGAGDDYLETRLTFDSCTDVLHGGLGNDTLRSAGGGVNSYGEDGNDLMIGAFAGGHHGTADTLVGGAGNDTFQGGGWFDGGDGNDLVQSSGCVHFDGGLGNDTITGSGGNGYASFDIDGGIGKDVIDVMSYNALNVHGGDGNDTISGQSFGGLAIDGGAGADQISASTTLGATMSVTGGAGDDVVTVTTDHAVGTVSGGTGDDVVYVNALHGTSYTVEGNAGNDTLEAGDGMATLKGGAGADTFVLAAQEILGTNMDVVADFSAGLDHLSISQSGLPVGNGDQQIDGAVVINGPGGFGTDAELVIVAADIFGDLTLDSAAQAIGSANQDYAVGQTAMFMVDNGVDSWALYFQSLDGDATVSAAELSVIGHLKNAPSTGLDDFVFGA
jgi:Ca2+-binding RTX toxin-like protein